MELAAKEHGIGNDGFFEDENAVQQHDINHQVIFREDSIGKWTPRSLFFDSDSVEIDALVGREGIGDMLESGQFYSGNESSTSVTEGRYRNKDLID